MVDCGVVSPREDVEGELNSSKSEGVVLSVEPKVSQDAILRNHIIVFVFAPEIEKLGKVSSFHSRTCPTPPQPTTPS